MHGDAVILVTGAARGDFLLLKIRPHMLVHNCEMSELSNLPCYLNGEFTTLPNAKVSVMDRGFIFGDGVYEVVPAYKGKPFRFDEHMARLDRSLGEMRIENPRSRAQWREI